MSSPDLGGGGRVISSSEPLRGGRVMLSLGDITEGRNEGDEVTASSNWKLK